MGLRLLVLTLTGSMLAACGGGGRDVTSSELELYTWTQYVPQSVIDGFEERYGVTVNVTFYASNEEALDGVRANPGRYDLVLPSDYTVEVLIDDELLEPIDTTSDLENFGNVAADFRSPFFDPGGSLRQAAGKAPEPKYCIPYQWGTTGIAYDPAKVGFEPRTWNDVARPELRGKVALIDDPRDVLGAGLIATGHSKNDASPEALAEAADWVRSLDAVPVNIDNPERPLIDGEAVISIMYNGNAAEAIRAKPEISYVLPESGSIWFDNLCIPKDAPHRDAALAFMDYVLEAEVGADITRFFGYSTPNEASLDLMEKANDPAIDNEATNPSRDALHGLLLTKDVGDEGAALFDATWKEIRP